MPRCRPKVLREALFFLEPDFEFGAGLLEGLRFGFQGSSRIGFKGIGAWGCSGLRASRARSLGCGAWGLAVKVRGAPKP